MVRFGRVAALVGGDAGAWAAESFPCFPLASVGIELNFGLQLARKK